MSFENLAPYCFLGAAGAAALELLKLYEYRGKLHLKVYQRQMRSFVFWGVVVGMLLASGFVAWAVHAGHQNVQVWHVVITGIAARTVIRSAVAAQLANSSTKLGDDDDATVTMRDIFL